MTLEQFAKKAGMSIVRCDKEWGGTWGFVTKDYPNTTIAGYRTEQAAYKGWLRSTFGEQAGKAVLSLLDKG